MLAGAGAAPLAHVVVSAPALKRSVFRSPPLDMIVDSTGTWEGTTPTCSSRSFNRYSPPTKIVFYK